jgi:hypothetical protein
MPGTHGSATQCTNPIGEVSIELIRNFMEKKGTTLKGWKKQPIEMCNLFAGIHAKNPLNHDGSKRLIFDDGGYAKKHEKATKIGMALSGS